MFLADKVKDYTVLDTGDGEKLENVGGVVLQRPDPQVIWAKSDPQLWKPHAVYVARHYTTTLLNAVL